jgi:hypothetical protein
MARVRIERPDDHAVPDGPPLHGARPCPDRSPRAWLHRRALRESLKHTSIERECDCAWHIKPDEQERKPDDRRRREPPQQNHRARG